MNVLLALHSRESPRYLSRGAGKKMYTPAKVPGNMNN